MLYYRYYVINYVSTKSSERYTPRPPQMKYLFHQTGLNSPLTDCYTVHTCDLKYMEFIATIKVTAGGFRPQKVVVM
jgi:hypothetical protein